MLGDNETWEHVPRVASSRTLPLWVREGWRAPEPEDPFTPPRTACGAPAWAQAAYLEKNGTGTGGGTGGSPPRPAAPRRAPPSPATSTASLSIDPCRDDLP